MESSSDGKMESFFTVHLFIFPSFHLGNIFSHAKGDMKNGVDFEIGFQFRL